MGADIEFVQAGGGSLNLQGDVTTGSATVDGGDIRITASDLIEVYGTLSTLSGSGGVVDVFNVGVNFFGATSAGAGDIHLSGQGADLDVFINAGTQRISADDITIRSLRDIVVAGLIRTTAADASVSLMADTDNDGSGGVLLQPTGRIESGYQVLIQGSDLFLTAENGDSVRIADSGADDMITAAGLITIRSSDHSAADARVVVDGDITSTGTEGIVLTGSGGVELGATVLAGSGPVTVGPAATLTADTMLVTAGGDVTLTGGVKGAYALAIQSGTGDVDIDGDTGAAGGEPTILTVDAAGLRLGGSTFVSGAMDIDATAGVDVEGPVTTTSGGTVTISNTGTLTVAPGADISAAGGFVQDGSGGVSLAADVGTPGQGISFAGPVVLAGAVRLDTGAGGGGVSFAGTVDGGYGLTVSAGTGNAVFGANVGAATPLASLTVTDAAQVQFDGGVAATGTVAVDANAGGVSIISGILTASAAVVEAHGPVTLNTALGSLAVNTTAAGDVVVAENDAIVIDAVTASDGAVSITAGGDLEAVSVVSSTDREANDVTLRATAGDVILGSVRAAGSGDVSVFSDAGGITDGLADENANITGQLVTLRSAIGMGQGDGLDLVAQTLDAQNQGSGDMCLRQLAAGGALELTGFAQTDAAGGNAGLLVQDGTLTIAAPVSLAGSGDLMLRAESRGSAANLSLDNAVTLSGGDASLYAGGDVLQNADILTSGGTVDIEAGGAVVMAPATSVATSGANARLVAAGDLRLAAVDAGAGDVAVSAGGSIVDAGETHTDVTASGVRMEAGGAVGTALDPLEIDVDTVAAASGNGGVYLVQTGPVTIGAVDTVPVTRLAACGSTVTAQSDTVLGGITTTGPGNVRLTTQAGSVIVEHAILASGDGDIDLLAQGAGSDVFVNAPVRSSGGDVVITAPDTVYQGASVIEGGTMVITGAWLSISDADDDPADIVYTLSSIPLHGAFTLSGTQLNPGDAFTQADLDNHRILYTHDGGENHTDSFAFSVVDGTGGFTSGAFDIMVDPQNDAPTHTLPGATASTNEGSDLDLSMIRVSDPDVGTNLIETTLSILPGTDGALAITPADGVTVLENTGETIRLSGTIDQVNATLATLEYRLDPAASPTYWTDTLTITTSDGGASGYGGEQVTTDTVGLKVNDVFVFTDNGLVLDEGDTVLIGTGSLSVTDNDDTPAELVYTLTQAPLHGELRVGGTALAQGDTFTQEDVATGNLAYAHDGGESGADSFGYSLTDGDGSDAAGVFDITMAAMNDAPVNTLPAGPLNTNEGVAILLSGVRVDDPDAGSGSILVTLQVTGAARLDLTAQGAVAFPVRTATLVQLRGTLADVNATLATLVYQPTVSNAHFSDTLTMTTSDEGNSGAGGALQDTDTVSIRVNDVPVVSNTGLVMDEGAAVVVGSGVFLVNDADNLPAELTIELVSVPAHGILALSGTALAAGDTFTQADINANLLTYTHQGTEESTDVFSYTVSDGGGGTVSNNFSIFISPVNDAPVNTLPAEGFTTNEGVNRTLAGISVADADAGVSPLTVSLTLTGGGSLSFTPQAGITVLSSTSTFIRMSGSLTALNNTLATLRYNVAAGYYTASLEMVTSDQGNSGGGGAKTDTDSVAIKVNDVSSLTVGTPAIDEGGALLFDGTHLSATDNDNTADELVYTVTSLPTGGALELSGTPVSANGTFTQADVDSGRLCYVHGGGEQASDSFVFRLEDGDGTSRSGVFSIQVNAVNDAPALDAPEEVVTGEETPVAVAVSITDPDAANNGIIATLSLDPAVGKSVLSVTPAGVVTITGNGTADMTITGTLTNVNQTLASLVYAPQPGTGHFTDTITISVTDNGHSGAGGARVTTVDVDVFVNDVPTVSTNLGLTLDEGATAGITNARLAVVDNDNTPAEVVFTVTDAPDNGQVLLDGSPLSAGDTFTQADVDNNLVAYAHDGTETTSDSFAYSVRDTRGATETGFFTITINPVNDAPEHVVPATPVNTNEGVHVAVNGLTVSDVETPAAGLLTTTVTVGDPASGRATISVDTSLAVVTGSGTGEITIIGTAAQINSTLATLVYTPNPAATPSHFMDTLTLATNDGQDTGTDTFQVRVNDVPEVGTSIAGVDVVTDAAGNVEVTAQGGSLTMAVGSSVSTESGDLSLLAATDLRLADGTVAHTESGALTLEARTGSVAMGEGSEISSTSGDVQITASQDDVTVGSDSLVTAGTGALSVTADGSIAVATAAALSGDNGVAVQAGAGIAFADGTTVQSDGGPVNLDAQAGSTSMGDGVSVAANGGGLGINAGNGTLSTGTGFAAGTAGGDVSMSSTGDLSLGAGSTVDAAGGTVVVDSVSGSVLMGAGSAVTTNAGVSVSAGTNVDITLIDAGAGAVNVSAQNGYVADDGDASADVIGSSATVHAGTTAAMDTSVGSLAYTAAGGVDVTQVAAGGSLVLSGTTTGSVNVVVANGGLSSGSGTIGGTSLDATAAGGIDADTIVDEVSVRTTAPGDLSIDNAGALTITDAVTFDGSVIISAGGAMNAVNVVAGDDGGDDEHDVSLATTSGDLAAGAVESDDDATLDAAGSITDGAGTVVADTLVLEAGGFVGTSGAPLTTDVATVAEGADADTDNAAGPVYLVNSGGVVLARLQTANGGIEVQAGGTIDAQHVVSTTSAEANDIVLTATTGDILAGLVSAGRTAGDVTLSAASGSVSDATAGETANVMADFLTIMANSGVGALSDDLDIAANTLDVENTGSESIRVTQTTAGGGLAVQGLLLSDAAGIGWAVVQTEAGNLSLAGAGATVAGSGSLRLDAAGAGTNLSVNAPVNVVRGDVSLLAANSVSFGADGDVMASGGTVDIEGTAGGVGMDAGTEVAAGDSNVRITAGTTVTLGSVDAGTGQVAVNAGGAVTDAGAGATNVTASALRFDVAGMGSGGNAIETLIATIAGVLGSGDFFVTNTGDLVIGTVGTVPVVRVLPDGGTGTAADGSSVTGITGGGGDVSVSTKGALDVVGAVSNTGAGALRLVATGAAGDVTVDARITSGTGGVTVLAANSVDQNADITTGGGTLDVEAQTGTVDMATGVSGATNGGNIRYAGGQDVLLGSLNAGTGGVSIVAESGSILDNGDTLTDIIADRLRVQAGTGVGSETGPDFLETLVNTIAGIAGPGGIYVHNGGDIVVDLVDNIAVSRLLEDGTLRNFADSDLADLVATGGGSIVLRTTNGDITVNDGDGDGTGVTVDSGGNVALEPGGANNGVDLNTDVSSGSGVTTLKEGRNVTFLWDAVPGVRMYYVTLYMNGQVYDTAWVFDETRWAPGYPLSMSDYEFKVWPWASTDFGQHSEALPFTVQDDSHTPSGVLTSGQDVSFSWSGTPDASSHFLRIRRNGEAYATQLVNGSTAWSADHVLPWGHYEWTIQSDTGAPESDPIYFYIPA
ncbi:MAG: beta strand repeat-containing protein [Desulfatibacillaceae bacterium]